MKNLTITALIILTLIVSVDTLATLDKNEKSCAGSCCGGKSMAMADMQDHSQHKHKQSTKDATAKKEEMKIQTEYTCPMHSDIKSEKPGKCPKCKMDLVEEKKVGKKSLMKQKMEAMKDGKYNCCLQEPCDECLKAHRSCDCKKAVKNDKPVCNECYDGWQKGDGDVSGKEAKDIKKGHNH
ncbi:MAG: hypothetical protein M0R68_08510 [Bacteroidetes bacterium]|nr:hypothetical protein [Bacteroidota bacterium]